MYNRIPNMDARVRQGSYIDPRTGNPQAMAEPAFNMSGANTPASGQALNAPRGGEDISFVPKQQNTQATMDMYTQDPGRYQGLQGVPDWAAQGPDDLLRREMTGYSPDDMLGMYDRARQPEINPEYLQNFKANSGIDMVEAEMGDMRQLQQANQMLQGQRSYDGPRYGQPEERLPIGMREPRGEPANLEAIMAAMSPEDQQEAFQRYENADRSIAQSLSDDDLSEINRLLGANRFR